MSHIAKPPKQKPSVTYLNVVIRGEEPSGTAKATPAQQEISRSGTIVGDTDQYYVSVNRLRFVVNIPIAYPPLKFPDFTADGLTTDWSLTIRYTNPSNTITFGRAYIKLQKPASLVRTGLTTVPLDNYASFGSLTEWRDALNEALAATNADCRAASDASYPAFDPFFSILEPGTGKLKLTVNPYDTWDSAATGGGQLDLFCNWAAEPAFGGWDLTQARPDGSPLSPEGADFQFIIKSDGYNYEPANAAGAESLVPTTSPATLIINQTSPCFTMPGITRISILSSMSVIPEFVPSRSGPDNSSEKVLTDFSPDLSQVTLGDNRTTFIYNSAIGDTRWLRMSGGTSLSNFSVRVVTEDWQGNVRPFLLKNVSESVAMKLCFAPLNVVEK
mgnify:CR=1 FL=1